MIRKYLVNIFLFIYFLIFGYENNRGKFEINGKYYCLNKKKQQLK